MKAPEFHWTDGWYFARLSDGSVHITHQPKHDGVYTSQAIIPPAQWASIVAHLVDGGTAGTYQAVEKLHGGAA